MSKNFCAFILTWKRANNVVTYRTLREHGYTGDIVLIVDDLDPQIEDYKNAYGDQVYVFSKKHAKSITDDFTNNDDMRAVVYARNMVHSIAKELWYEHFIELDDDYMQYIFRFDDEYRYFNKWQKIKSLDTVFAEMVGFLKSDKRILTVAIAQGWDFIGGDAWDMAHNIKAKRKAMNSFVCATDRPFQFYGKINEDVNCYLLLGSVGHLLFTTSQISLNQTQTQKNSGGLTEIYLDSWTYVKSFYSVMCMPSAVKITLMWDNHKRIHHRISWGNTVPKILREEHKK